MREILFRGKRLDNGEWIAGCLVKYAYNSTPYIGYLDAWGDGIYKVDPTTTGQLTSLCDKNGKKIFEGDIIKYKNTDGVKFNGVALTVTGKVVYNEKNASFAISGKDEIGAKHYDYFTVKNIEVIGNIHDNPELLEGEG